MRFTTRSLALAIACLGLSTLLVSPAFAQGDPQVGVWKLNVAKSKYTPGPVPKAGTTKIEAAGGGVKVVVDQTMADGTERHFEFTANYDGKDSPVTGNYPRCRHGRAHEDQCEHRADDQQEGRQGHDHSDIRGVG